MTSPDAREPDVRLSRSQMMSASKAYYLEGRSKVDIAGDLGVSRFKVARLLEAARKVGMVSITLNNGASLPGLSAAVAEHLSLRSACVVEVYGDDKDVRTAVGRATGDYLRDSLADGEVLGIGWGRTLGAMFDNIDSLPNIEVLQLSGRLHGTGWQSDQELMSKAAAITGKTPHVITASFFADDPRATIALRRTPEVASVMSRFEDLTVAVVGIGAIGPRPISMAYANLPQRFLRQLFGSGAVGEVQGILFGEDGRPIRTKLGQHTLAITAQQLARIGRVIAAAADPAKARAVRAVCSSGILTDIVVDVSLAHALLALPRITSTARVASR